MPADTSGSRWSTKMHASKTITATVVVAAVLVLLSSSPAEAVAGKYAFFPQDFLRGSSFVVVKGRRAPPLGPFRLIRYAQAFALNNEQEEIAASRGWLLRSCSGAVVHHGDNAILNFRKPTALSWRASVIASHVNSGPYYGTYLDTLRVWWPYGYYDRAPCRLTHSQAFRASLALVKMVKARTGGKYLIENGRGIGDTLSYQEHPWQVHTLEILADGVQIEQFMLRPENLDLYVAEMKRLGRWGLTTFAKCKNSPRLCRRAFELGLNGDAYMTVMPRA